MQKKYNIHTHELLNAFEDIYLFRYSANLYYKPSNIYLAHYQHEPNIK